MKPILFNSEMVCAILDGRKSQTRRIIKPQPITEDEKYQDPPEITVDGDLYYSRLYMNIKCPYGKVGDKLWVREKHAIGANGPFFPDNVDGSVYVSWTSGRYMKKEFARIFLEITDIRVERVQDITTEDVWAEGIDKDEYETWREDVDNIAPEGSSFEQPKDLFAKLWNSIHGKDAWERNDFVWVVEFKKVDK